VWLLARVLTVHRAWWVARGGVVRANIRRQVDLLFFLSYNSLILFILEQIANPHTIGKYK